MHDALARWPEVARGEFDKAMMQLHTPKESP